MKTKQKIQTGATLLYIIAVVGVLAALMFYLGVAKRISFLNFESSVTVLLILAVIPVAFIAGVHLGKERKSGWIAGIVLCLILVFSFRLAPLVLGALCLSFLLQKDVVKYMKKR